MMLQSIQPCIDDYLSFNAMLPHILSLLDAKQVLRCMRVNKRFYSIILNNWQHMQKIAINLCIKPKEHFQCVSDNEFPLCVESTFPQGDYNFTIEDSSVSIRCQGTVQPVQNLFQTQLDEGRAVEIWMHGRVTKMKPPSRVNELIHSVLSKMRIRKSRSNPVIPLYFYRPSSEFTGKFRVSCDMEGLYIVLNFLLSRCDLESLQIGSNSMSLPEHALHIIHHCVGNTRVKLLNAATICQISKFLTETLKHIEAPEIKIRLFKDLDNYLLFLHTGNCQISIKQEWQRSKSILPIAALIEEWQQGKRSIQVMKVYIAKYNFSLTVEAFQEVLKNVERFTVVSSSERDIEVSLKRDCDSKILSVKYNMDDDSIKYATTYAEKGLIMLKEV